MGKGDVFLDFLSGISPLGEPANNHHYIKTLLRYQQLMIKYNAST